MRIEVVILVILLQIASVAKTQSTINMSETMATKENMEATTATTKDYDVTRKTDAHSSEFTTGTQDVQSDVTGIMETVSDQDEEELEGEDEYYEEDEENEEEEEGYEYYDDYTENDDVPYDGYDGEGYEGDDVTYGDGYDEDEYPEDDETEMYEFEYDDDEDGNKTLDSYKQQDYLNGTTNKTRHRGATRGRWFCNQ